MDALKTNPFVLRGGAENGTRVNVVGACSQAAQLAMPVAGACLIHEQVGKLVVGISGRGRTLSAWQAGLWSMTIIF